MKKTPSNPRFSKSIGHTFAYLQHGADRLIEWGFTKIKETGDSSEPVVIENKYLDKGVKAGKSVFRFLGGMGTAYYEKYEELKRKN